jgi:Sugar kinases, ribokinase family
MSKSILFIGGSNVDYLATSENELIPHSSNIGHLEISFGGVMRNVVENVARLGAKCVFISAIGDDLFGKEILSYMKKLKVEMYCPKTCLPTSAYLAINNANHDMDVAINDMRVINEVTPSYLATLKPIISTHDFIVIDSNLSKETLKYLFDTYKDKKFIVEGISATKIMKFAPYLNQIHLLKCNINEARAISKIVDGDAPSIIKSILLKGTKIVIISQGKDDIYYGYEDVIDHLPTIKNIEISGNTTGCGDALFAGIVDHYLNGYSLKASIEFGETLSALTLKSIKANSEEVSNLKYKHK